MPEKVFFDELWDDDTLLAFADELSNQYFDLCALEGTEDCADCPYGIQVNLEDGTREFECAGTFAAEIYRRLMNRKFSQEEKSE